MNETLAKEISDYLKAPPLDQEIVDMLDRFIESTPN